MQRLVCRGWNYTVKGGSMLGNALSLEPLLEVVAQLLSSMKLMIIYKTHLIQWPSNISSMVNFFCRIRKGIGKLWLLYARRRTLSSWWEQHRNSSKHNVDNQTSGKEYSSAGHITSHQKGKRIQQENKGTNNQRHQKEIRSPQNSKNKNKTRLSKKKKKCL